MSIPTILPGFKYLVETRKLNEETIRAFHLSYLDQQGNVYIGAEFKGAGLTIPSFFAKNSVLFPILDLHGNEVAISSRPLGASSKKYINSVYEKKDHLYGLYQTWRDCLQARSVYVVEGNVSLLTPWQHGVKNIVAMLGSAFSYTQLCLLSRFVKKIVFVTDNDDAGNEFLKTMRQDIRNEFYDTDVKFFYVELPAGSDPDDYFKQGHTLADFKALPEKELKL